MRFLLGFETQEISPRRRDHMRDLLKISSVTSPRAEGKETTLATRVFASSTALLYGHAAPCGGNLETYNIASEAICRVDDSQMNG
jgi:hypothetical protein